MLFIDTLLLFSFAFDVVRKGYLLAYDKVLKITVTQLYKVNQMGCYSIGLGIDVPLLVQKNQGGISSAYCTGRNLDH